MKREDATAILADHGRQALARVIYVEMPGTHRDIDLFYEMYAPGRDALEPGDAFYEFDPALFESFYRQGDPWFKRAIDLDDSGTIEGLIDAHLNGRAPPFSIETLHGVFNSRETRDTLSAAPEGTKEFELFSWLCNLSEPAQVACFVFLNRRWPNAGSEDEFERAASETYHTLLSPEKD
ncbi:hypothetical protein [Caballeronia sordidicola]|uniref:hypothetical protein n=1 Tax=Caballeronia sordidicola TaxID=196367 RepID=UPI0004CFF583|nr:hypothetical protein [Caballeronia sordidicola]